MVEQAPHDSPPVLDVLLAFSSSHLEHRGIQDEGKSLHLYNKALQGLGRLIDNFDKANKEEVLSTIMLLVYYEVVSMKTASILLPMAEFRTACSTELWKYH